MKRRGEQFLNKLKKLRSTKILFVGITWNIFQPQEVPILKQHIIFSYFFRLNNLKSTANAPAVDFFEAEDPKRQPNRFLTVKKQDQ